MKGELHYKSSLICLIVTMQYRRGLHCLPFPVPICWIQAMLHVLYSQHPMHNSRKIWEPNPELAKVSVKSLNSLKPHLLTVLKRKPDFYYKSSFLQIFNFQRECFGLKNCHFHIIELFLKIWRNWSNFTKLHFQDFIARALLKLYCTLVYMHVKSHK